MDDPCRQPLTRRALAIGLVLALPLGLLGACGDEPTADGPSAGDVCDGPVTEALEPGSTLHLLPNAPVPEDGAVAPSSGPHVMGTGHTGMVDTPLAPAVQVGILERGDVLVQYGPDIEAPSLTSVAGEHVVVAPNPGVEGVMVTAWRHRLTCTAVDLEAIEHFADAFADRGPQMGTIG